jgi:hypothetical protein
MQVCLLSEYCQINITYQLQVVRQGAVHTAGNDGVRLAVGVVPEHGAKVKDHPQTKRVSVHACLVEPETVVDSVIEGSLYDTVGVDSDNDCKRLPRLGPKSIDCVSKYPFGPQLRLFASFTEGLMHFVQKHNLVPVFMHLRKKKADVLEKCNTTFVILLPYDKLSELVQITS